MESRILLAVSVLLTLALFAFAITANAQTTYYVSPTGNDATGDGSASTPWRTIGYAVGQASAGDTIKVMDDDDEATDD